MTKKVYRHPKHQGYALCDGIVYKMNNGDPKRVAVETRGKNKAQRLTVCEHGLTWKYPLDQFKEECLTGELREDDTLAS